MVRNSHIILLASGLVGAACVKQVEPLRQDPVTEREQAQAAEVRQASPTGHEECQDGLFSETTEQGSVALEDDGTIVRRRFVTVDFDRLSAAAEGSVGGAERLTLNLFDDVCLVALRAADEHGAAGPATWNGRVEADAGGRVTLVGRDDSLVGTIDVGGVLYRVQDVGEGVHAVLQIDQSKFPEEAQPLSPADDG